MVQERYKTFRLVSFTPGLIRQQTMTSAIKNIKRVSIGNPCFNTDCNDERRKELNVTSHSLDLRRSTLMTDFGVRTRLTSLHYDR